MRVYSPFQPTVATTTRRHSHFLSDVCNYSPAGQRKVKESNLLGCYPRLASNEFAPMGQHSKNERSNGGTLLYPQTGVERSVSDTSTLLPCHAPLNAPSRTQPLSLSGQPHQLALVDMSLWQCRWLPYFHSRSLFRHILTLRPLSPRCASLVHQEGFEPPTCTFVACCSVR
jgi:hypothetical protein